MTPLDKEIVKGMADNDMRIGLVAKSLYMHHNTVRYHLDRIKFETGLDARKFYDLGELLQMIEEA